MSPKVEVCLTCRWQGVISYQDPQRCAYFLRLRKMRKAGLCRLVIVGELGISHAMFDSALNRLGLATPKTPK